MPLSPHPVVLSCFPSPSSSRRSLLYLSRHSVQWLDDQFVLLASPQFHIVAQSSSATDKKVPMLALFLSASHSKPASNIRHRHLIGLETVRLLEVQKLNTRGG